jgi:succinate-semialdehyde dehydrogenase / glutarate-semialdehyde dehydrogenase
VNVLPSAEDGASDALLTDPRLAKLVVTGSSALGGHLAGLGAPRSLRLGTELGGRAPFIVLADADIERAVEGAVVAKLRNAGQSCTAANRFLVARSIADEFAEAVAARFAAVRIGRGTRPDVELGPMASPDGARRTADLGRDALLRGARVVLHGGGMPGPGNFVAPTVLSGACHASRAVNEEIFGPLAVVSSFDTEAEAVREANASPMGLAGYVYSRDMERAIRLGSELECGMVGINRPRVSDVAAPFGGIKESGVGRAGGPDCLEGFLETRYLAVEGMS